MSDRPATVNGDARAVVPVLAVDDVQKSFGSEHVLRGVSLAVPEHTVTVLIGASGSGKSTLLRCVNLLDRIDDGSILLDGRDIADPEVDPDQVRRQIGMVFQSFNLFPHLTVLQNVTLAPRKVHKVPREQAEAEGRALLERFGLADKAQQYPDRLSGGQQQRAAIVRSLAVAPRLMLMDEVTSALDPVLVNEVLATVRELKGEGMTMVIATHEMGFAEQVADEVCFLESGRILERGTPDAVLHAPQQAATQDFLRRVHEAGRL
ncbi:MAG TPA: amino acid ABC transporter ATP-binding protein [Candidatus Nanopelagicales bacterium]